jgi:hypothetical protein
VILNVVKLTDQTCCVAHQGTPTGALIFMYRRNRDEKAYSVSTSGHISVWLRCE